VLNGLYAAPVLTLSHLEVTGATNVVFKALAKEAKFYSRCVGSSQLQAVDRSHALMRLCETWILSCTHSVHDKKIMILALSSLLMLPFNSLPDRVRKAWPQLAPIFAEMFNTMPQAVERTPPAKVVWRVFSPPLRWRRTLLFLLT